MIRLITCSIDSLPYIAIHIRINLNLLSYIWIKTSIMILDICFIWNEVISNTMSGVCTRLTSLFPSLVSSHEFAWCTWWNHSMLVLSHSWSVWNIPVKTCLGSSLVRVEALESTTVIFLLLHAEKNETLHLLTRVFFHILLFQCWIGTANCITTVVRHFFLL